MATTRDKYILEIETEQASRNLGRTQGAVGSLLGSLGRLGPLAAGAAAAFGGFAAIQGIQNTVDSMDALAKQARNLNVEGDAAQETFQRFGTILADAGISQEQYVEASRRAIDRLSRGGKQAESVMAKIGESLQDANGALLSGPELLQKLNVAFNEGAITAEEFQSIVGVRLGPIVNRALGEVAGSAEDMAAAMERAGESTNFVDQETLNNAEAFNDNMAAMGRQIQSIGTQLVSALLPYMKDFTDNLLARMPGIIEGVKNAFANLEPVFSLIGTVLTNLVFPIMQKVFEVLGLIASAITPLIEFALPALEGGFNLIATAIQFVIDKITAVLEFFGQVITKAREMGSAVAEAFSNMTGGVVEKAKAAYDGVTGWFGRMYDYVVGNSVVPDMAREVLENFDGMGSGMIESIANTIGKVIPAFQNVASSIADRFQEITGISLQSVRNQVSTVSNSIYNSISSLASSVSSRLSSIMGSIRSAAGRVGDFFGGFSFSNPFAGFFAKGGFIPKGQFGVVGEAGPELVSGPAQVTPMSQMQPQQVTYNINAVDASSFRALLARDPSFVHAVVQRGQLIGGRR